MELNEKKPKRPRIGQQRTDDAATPNSTYDNNNNGYDRAAGDSSIHAEGAENSGRSTYRPQGYQPRPYQPRPYNNRQGDYRQYDNNGEGGGYNRQPRQYNPRPYNHQPEGAPNSAPVGVEGHEGAEGEGQQQQRRYQPRQYNSSYNNNRQGQHNGYNRQGGYNNNRQGYNNNRQGGYNNDGQGGYNNRQGGYNNNRQGQQGGYSRQGQQGGYNNNRQGYNNNRQGGYNNNRQGGYNNRPGQNRYNNGPQRNGFKGKSFTPTPKQIEYEMPIPDPNEQIRLNKFMANAGICSRREADEFIQQGLVKVNGNVVTELGTKITHSDVVEYDEKVVALERKCYILLNKPKDCVTTSDDPNGRTTVMDIVKGACKERIYPVGRLDRNTTGVLLLTNDGDLASKLTHPQYVKKKIYHVWTDKDVTEEDMQRIADGIELDDGEIHADAIGYATETDRNQVGIEIHSGRNRIVRRIFESLGYHVTKLDRVYFAGLTKKNLPRGRWRYLTQEEVNFLKMGSFE